MLRIKLLILTALFGLISSAIAEERIALVVGNGAYGAIPKLANPLSDATLIAESLGNLGFKVELLKDSNLLELKKGIAKFGRQLRAGGKETTGLFYYAGHGVQSFGTNYLLPVDTSLTDAADLDLVAVDAGSILRQMFSAKNKTNIVILDACRDNPFLNIPEFGTNGLAEMQAPTGTFLAYATAPGNVALDGSTGNSPFSAALAREMIIPGVPIEQVFKRVRINVLQNTDGSQTPWDTSSLTGQFYFAEPIALSKEELAERQMWNSVKFSRDMLQIMLFLRSYPESKFGNQAKKLLTEIVADLDTSGPGDDSGNSLAANTLPTPEMATPELREQDMIDKAQGSGKIADYEAYVEKFPDGVFAELARIEIDSLRNSQSTDAEVMPETNQGLTIVSNVELSETAINSSDNSTPAQTPEDSEAREQKLIDLAQSSGSLSDYEFYLTEFPGGTYAELAQFEIATIKASQKKSTSESASSSKKPEEVAEVVEVAVAPSSTSLITFQTPLTIGTPEIIGKSIEELIQDSPLYSPIAGLPEEFWLDQNCSNCHNWNQDNLCTQAQGYAGENAETLLAKKHPYGGSFKKNLGSWVAGGCQ